MRTSILKTICIFAVFAASAVTTQVQAIKVIKGKKYFSYLVQAGESIDNLTNAFKVSEADLLAQNPNIKNGLKEGTILLIPVKENMLDANLPEISVITYKVKPGDTLYSLAKNNNSTIEDIIQRNVEALGDGVLRAGSTIKIARNSGGLTGGEDAKRAKEKLAKQKQQDAERAALAASADSLTKIRAAYWTEPWTVINVVKAGTIDSLRNENQWRAIKRLKVTGTINCADVAVVGKRIFEFDHITALDLHEALGLKKICSKDFEECTSLLSIALPNSIDSIGRGSFVSSGNLDVIRCYAVNPPACTENSFDNVNLHCIIEVPKVALEKYKVAKEWKKFTTIRAIPTANN